jgi:hypothetical protein
MSVLPWRKDESDTIRPSLIHNGSLALGCAALAVALFATANAKIEGALLLAIFLMLSAAVIMSAHLPGCTGIWFDDEGFLTRDIYRSERYRWSEIGPFSIRRRLLGTQVDFAYTPPGEAMPQTRTLPRGMGRSAVRLARRMNERRERALATAR